MSILYIDTSSNKEIKAGLSVNGKRYWLKKPIGHQKAQIVLPLIDQLLKEHELTPSDIEGIDVNIGPGSFTGLRVGIAVANALGFALNIPVNGKRQITHPTYG